MLTTKLEFPLEAQLECAREAIAHTSALPLHLLHRKGTPAAIALQAPASATAPAAPQAPATAIVPQAPAPVATHTDARTAIVALASPAAPQVAGGGFAISLEDLRNVQLKPTPPAGSAAREAIEALASAEKVRGLAPRRATPKSAPRHSKVLQEVARLESALADKENEIGNVVPAEDRDAVWRIFG